MSISYKPFFYRTIFILFLSLIIPAAVTDCFAASAGTVKAISYGKSAIYDTRGLMPPCQIVQRDASGKTIAIIDIDRNGNIVATHNYGSSAAVPSSANIYGKRGGKKVLYAENRYDSTGNLVSYVIYAPAVSDYLSKMQLTIPYWIFAGVQYPAQIRMEYTDTAGNTLRDVYMTRQGVINRIEVNNVAREREIARHAVQYGASGRILGRADFNTSGVITRYIAYEYDSAGHLSKRTHIDGSTQRVTGFSTYQYNANGDRVARFGFDANGRQTSLALYKPSYDASGNFIGSVPANTSVSNLILRPMQAISGSFPSRVVCYDANDSAIRTILFDQNLPNGHVLFVMYHNMVSMAANPVTARFYDSSNKLTATNSYDLQGNLVSYTLFGSTASASGLPLLQSYGVTAASTAVHYDANGDPIKTIVYGVNGVIDQLTVHQINKASDNPSSVNIFDPNGAIVGQFQTSSGGRAPAPQPPPYQPTMNEILARQEVQDASRRQTDSSQGTTYVTTGSLAEPESHQDLWPR